MTDWQPIATFFKRSDTTGDVLLYVPGRGVIVGRCMFGGGHFWETADGRRSSGDPSEKPMLPGAGPTHWMPLPSPPGDQQ